MIMIKNKPSQPYSIWLWIAFIIIIGIGIYRNLIGGLLLLAIFCLCKPFFERWAKEIGKSPTIPFIILLAFGLVGHLGYYIYYRCKRK